MNVFDDEFQEYISWKVGEAFNEIEDETEWKELNNNYGVSHDIIYNSINEEQKDNFDKFLNILWKKVSVELCVSYKIGMTDKERLNKYIKK